MSAEESRDPSTGSFAGDVDSGEDMKTKGEESGQDGNFSGDDTSLEERQKSGKDFNLNSEKIGGHVVREDDESPEKLNNVEPAIVRDTSPSFGQKPHIDSRMTDENSMDDFKVNSQETSLPRTAPSKQRVVTFEDMSREHTYRGPLISSDQLMEPGEDLAKIVFCRHFVSTVHENGPEQDRGYSEYSVAVLAERLKQCQQLYNSRERQPLDLVFFEQAVRHAARISRCLVR